VFLGLNLSAFTFGDQTTFQYRTVKNKAFTYGEKLNFRIHYGILNAAYVNIVIDEKPTLIEGRPTFHITTKGNTYKHFDFMYKVRDHFESYVDTTSMAPLKYYKSVQEDKYKDHDLVFYHHDTKKLNGYKKNMDMPEYVQDIVSALYYARTLEYGTAYVGKTFPIDVYLDQTIYNLKFKYLGKETIKTGLGKIECIKLRPQLVVDRVFKDEDDMTVWISADKNHIPIRIQTDIFVGSLKVDLESYSGLNNIFEALVK
jgi:hypothetical protein